jgi:hypothetical protein
LRSFIARRNTHDAGRNQPRNRPASARFAEASSRLTQPIKRGASSVGTLTKIGQKQKSAKNFKFTKAAIFVPNWLSLFELGS